MIRRDYLIVGAGAGGVSACEGIREHDKKGTIMLVGNETAIPYQRPLLFSSLLYWIMAWFLTGILRSR